MRHKYLLTASVTALIHIWTQDLMQGSPLSATSKYSVHGNHLYSENSIVETPVLIGALYSTASNDRYVLFGGAKFENGSLFPDAKLYVLDTATHEVVCLNSVTGLPIIGGSFSPTGDKLAVVHEDCKAISFIDFPSYRKRLITRSDFDAYFDLQPSWNSDGRSVAIFQRPLGVEHPDSQGSWVISSIEVDRIEKSTAKTLSPTFVGPVTQAAPWGGTDVAGDLTLRLPYLPGTPRKVTGGYYSDYPQDHTGYQIDFGLPEGTDVVAVAPGLVSAHGDLNYQITTPTHTVKDNGTYVRLWHVGSSGQQYFSWYLHLKNRDDKTNALNDPNNLINPGDLLGHSGNTGHTSPAGLGYHLHFQMNLASGIQSQEGNGVRPTPMQGTDVTATPHTSPITTFQEGDYYQAADIQAVVCTWGASGAPICNALTTIDGQGVGVTNQYGYCYLPTFYCGNHTIAVHFGSFTFSKTVSFICGSSNSRSQAVVSEATDSSNNVVPVDFYSNSTCGSIAPTSNLNVGDRIEVYGTGNGLRARYPDPCTDPPYRVMPDLSAGTIIGSWQCCSGYIRWKIRYDDLPGVDVWSAEGEPSTGQVFLRKKQNSTCSYSLAPGRLDLDTAGAAASGFNVNAGSSCYWTAVSNLDWISITTNTSGTGPAQITFSVSANNTPYSRTGNIVVGDQTFIVTQPGNGSATSDWALTLASTNPNSGVGITVRPNDTNGLGNGTTTFTRNYNAYTRVYVTAPAGVGSTTFKKWQRDGVDWSTSIDTDLTMEGNHTMTALYVPIPDHYLAVFISPEQVVNAGAKWYLQGTGPYDSGQAIGPFNPGTTIQSGFSYTPIAGWVAPPDQSVTIANSGPTIVRVNYTLAPTLSLSTNQISVGSCSGGANLLVTNPGGGTLNWSASTPDNWITLETPSGSTAGGANASLSFLFQPNASVGSRSGTVTVTANSATASPQSIIITQRDQVATPTISPNGGSYTGSIQVALACTSSDAAIHYTTDGSDPTLDSDIYSTPITLTSSTLVKAKATKDGSDDSNTASASFSFPPSPTPTPVPTPTGTPTATATPTVTPTPTATPAFPVQLGNIATRLKIGAGDNAMIGGFIITGSQQKAIIVRGIGPSLGALGVPGALADPIIEVHGSAGELLATNDNWMDDQPDRVQHVIDNRLAPTNNLESAKWGILNPGAYTVIVRGKDGGTGNGLFEIYDVDRTTDSKLGNVSTRGFVGTGDNAMIGGTIISGNTAAKVLFRAIGPSLTAFGVPNALQDPVLELHDVQGNLITSNDNWRTTQEMEIKGTGIPPGDDRESALLVTLQPGQYTAIVRGTGDSTGVALVEAYQLQ